MKTLRTLLLLCLLLAGIANPVYAVSGLLSDNHGADVSWADSVMATLSPRQRAAQLIFPNVNQKGAGAKALIRKYFSNNTCGGVLFDHSPLNEYAEIISYTRQVAKVPPLVCFDGEWGLSMRIKDAPRYPKNMALGAISDPSLLYEYGKEIARQCHLLGVQVNFAPVVDVNSNPANPVIGTRSFGSDPRRVGVLAAAYGSGLENGKVMAVAKHFPGHGDTSTDSHKTGTTVNHSRDELDNIDLLPFRSIISAGISGIMIGHLAVPALDSSNRPATASAPISNGLLRDELHFDGLAFTDALTMKGAYNGGHRNVVEAFEAGADAMLSSDSPVRDIDDLMKAVSEKRISQKEIDRRCHRILRFKYALGLSKPAPLKATDISGMVNSRSAEAVNRKLCAAAITVVWNKKNILPLPVDKAGDIAVVNIGEAAHNSFSDMCGRYTTVDCYGIAAGNTPDSRLIKEIAGHRIVIAAIYDSGAAARATLAKISAENKNIVTVFFTSVYSINKFRQSVQYSNALVAAYDDTPLLREYAAQALFGGISVSGRLPVELKGIAPLGSGTDIKKSRLGYGLPEMAGMQPWLGDSIDRMIKRALTEKAIPGAQVLVAHKGMVVHNKSYGRLTAGGAKVTDSTLYDLASVSKAVGTLPAIMNLYDSQLLSLDKNISGYIPELKGGDKADISVRQLLYHESGMPASLNMYDAMIDSNSYKGKLIGRRRDADHNIKIQNHAWGHRTARLRDDIVKHNRSNEFPTAVAKGLYVGQSSYDSLMNRIYNIGLRSNKNYNYSCLNFCLLMKIGENISHEPHNIFVARNVWEPLGAHNLTYRPAELKPGSVTAPTETDSFLRRQTINGYVHDELAAFSGGVQGNAGVFGNATDIAKLCQMWLQNGNYGGRQILSAKTVRLFTTDKSPTCRRGLGFDKPDTENSSSSPTCDEADPSVYGHLGFTGTVFWVDPSNDLIFIFLTNRVNPTRDNAAFNRMNLRPELFRLVYKSLISNS